MRCSKCNKWLSLITKFCPKCGLAIPPTVKKRAWLNFFGLFLFALLAAFIYPNLFNQMIGGAANSTNIQSNFVPGLILSTMLFSIILFLLVNFFKFFRSLIIKIKLISQHPFSGIISALVLLVIIVSAVWGVIGFITRQKTFSDKAGMLADGFFSDQVKSSPAMITYSGTQGKEITAYAYPGEINLFITPKTNWSTVNYIVRSCNGKILSQIPKLGFYLIGVEKGNEAAAIQKLLADQSSLVISAMPNLVVQASIVDLSGTGKINPGQITTALISTPNPNAKVIVAQLDNFVPLGDDKDVNLKNYGSFGSTDSHGYKVYDAMKSAGGEMPVMAVHVGGWPCERMPSALCSSADHTVNALAATIAGAEINGQKVVVNLSYNVSPTTIDLNQFNKANDPKSNSWATSQWQKYEEQLYTVLESSDWAKKGNVILNQSAGNGVQLVDINGDFLDSKGMDISNAIKELKQKYPIADTYVNFSGALNSKSGKLETYSNFGTGVIYVKLPPGSPDGTSFAAPLSTVASFKSWDKYSSFQPKIITSALQQYAKKTAEFYNLHGAMADKFYQFVNKIEADNTRLNQLHDTVIKPLNNIQTPKPSPSESNKKLDNFNTPVVNEPAETPYDSSQDYYIPIPEIKLDPNFTPGSGSGPAPVIDLERDYSAEQTGGSDRW